MYHNNESNCTISKEILIPITIVSSLLIAFIVVFSIGIVIKDFLCALLFFFAGVFITTVLHELVHYIAIKVFTKQSVDLRFYLKYFSFIVVYRELFWNQYIVVALFPQLLIELPLLLIYIVTGNSVILLVFIYHTFASLPDIVLSIRCLLVFRDCKLRMFIENNRIRGFYVIKPSGDCILYLL